MSRASSRVAPRSPSTPATDGERSPDAAPDRALARLTWRDALWQRTRSLVAETFFETLSGVASRLGFAFAGGALMGAGAVFARGCTSGQALTGGALLAVGSWLFVLTAFAAAFAAAPLLSRLWR